MHNPFRRKPRKTVVVTFTQEIDLQAVAAGVPVGATALILGASCSCGGKMRSNGPWVMTKPNSVTQPHACEGCGDKVDIVYTYDVKQLEAV